MIRLVSHRKSPSPTPDTVEFRNEHLDLSVKNQDMMTSHSEERVKRSPSVFTLVPPQPLGMRSLTEPCLVKSFDSPTPGWEPHAVVGDARHRPIRSDIYSDISPSSQASQGLEYLDIIIPALFGHLPSSRLASRSASLEQYTPSTNAYPVADFTTKHLNGTIAAQAESIRYLNARIDRLCEMLETKNKEMAALLYANRNIDGLLQEVICREWALRMVVEGFLDVNGLHTVKIESRSWFRKVRSRFSISTPKDHSEEATRRNSKLAGFENQITALREGTAEDVLRNVANMIRANFQAFKEGVAELSSNGSLRKSGLVKPRTGSWAIS